MNKIIKNNKGATIILITVLIMFSVLTVAMSLGTVVVNGLKVSSNQADATKAYFASEAGAEEVLWRVRKGSLNPTTCTSLEYILSASDSCSATLDASTITTQSNGSDFYIQYQENTPTTTLNSYGVFGETRRAIRLEY